MADYRVNLDIFAGPLDLLLYLVRKDEVDIYDIPIAKITDQYVKYIELMKELDIDVAGDFLVMAATLMQIKSAMLLPSTPGEALGEEDLTDPRAELIRQLLEYKRFKDAANLLAAAADERGERFNRPDTIIEQIKGGTEPTVDLDQISIWDLLEAFDKIMEATGAKFDIHNITDDTPIDLYQMEILHRLQTDGPTNFARIFEGRASRLVMAGLFLAILELIRSQLVRAELPQSDSAPVNSGELGQEQAGTSQADSTPGAPGQATNLVYLRAMTEEPAEEAVRKAILAVEAETTAEVKQKTEDPSSLRYAGAGGGPDFAQGATPGELRTEDREEKTQDAVLGTPYGEQKSVEEHPAVSLPNPPPIPIVEIPADETKKQSTEQLESMGGEASREAE